MRKFAILMLLSGMALAADVPTVPLDVQRDFWKARVAVSEAQAAAQKAQAGMDIIVAKLTAACGDKYQPSVDAKGDLTCTAKPAEQPKAK